MIYVLFLLITNLMALYMLYFIHGKYKLLLKHTESLKAMKEIYWQTNIETDDVIIQKKVEFTRLELNIRKTDKQLEIYKKMIFILTGPLLIAAGLIYWQSQEHLQIAAGLSVLFLVIQITFIIYFVIYLELFLLKINN